MFDEPCDPDDIGSPLDASTFVMVVLAVALYLAIVVFYVAPTRYRIAHGHWPAAGELEGRPAGLAIGLVAGLGTPPVFTLWCLMAAALERRSRQPKLNNALRIGIASASVLAAAALLTHVRWYMD